MKLAVRINEFFEFERARLMVFHKNWLNSTLEEKQVTVEEIMSGLAQRVHEECIVDEAAIALADESVQKMNELVASVELKERENVLNQIEICYVQDILAVLKLDM